MIDSSTSSISSTSSSTEDIVQLVSGSLYVVPPSYLGGTKFELTATDGNGARIVLNGSLFRVSNISGKLVWDSDDAHHSKFEFSGAVGQTTNQLSNDKLYEVEFRGLVSSISFLFNITFVEELSSSSSSSTHAMSTSSVSSSSSSSSQSSSTEAMTSSTSISSVNSSSSSVSTTSVSSSSPSSKSSSGNEGYQEIRFLFEGVDASPAWCLAERSGTIYAGTGPDGVVLKSSDVTTWTTFKTVTDCHVRSMIVWANALFMGTEPLGRIYVNNFSSNAFYLFVKTEDQVVTSFADFNGKLYAGTSPAGIVYTFDGARWEKVYRAYGRGINAMQVYESKLYVLLDRAETVPVFDGQSWSVLKIADLLVTKPDKGELLQNQTVASYRNTTTPPFSFDDKNPIEVVRLESTEEAIAEGSLSEEDKFAVLPPLPETGLKSAGVDVNAGLLLGGSHGQVFVYDQKEKTLRQKFGCAGGEVNAILNISAGRNIVAIGNELFVMKEV